ncbi:MAG: hypothetical protein LBH18_02825 [Spirochaetaceae bacterium]|nr:hypothetical protein [Spirochaetaceae bacterium]
MSNFYSHPCGRGRVIAKQSVAQEAAFTVMDCFVSSHAACFSGGVAAVHDR